VEPTDTRVVDLKIAVARSANGLLVRMVELEDLVSAHEDQAGWIGYGVGRWVLMPDVKGL
jgi:hypothetical protein